MEQIDKLANFIMSEIEGEPSQNEGAGDTAIRIIKQLRTSHAALLTALNRLKIQAKLTSDYEDELTGTLHSAVKQAEQAIKEAKELT